MELDELTDERRFLDARFTERFLEARFLDARFTERFLDERFLDARLAERFLDERFLEARLAERFLEARFTERFFDERFLEARFTERFFDERFLEARFTERFFDERFLEARFTERFFDERFLEARLTERFLDERFLERRFAPPIIEPKPAGIGLGPCCTFPCPEQLRLTHLIQVGAFPLNPTWYIFPFRPFRRVPKAKERGATDGTERCECFFELCFLTERRRVRTERFLAPPIRLEIKFSIIYIIP